MGVWNLFLEWCDSFPRDTTIFLRFDGYCTIFSEVASKKEREMFERGVVPWRFRRFYGKNSRKIGNRNFLVMENIF